MWLLLYNFLPEGKVNVPRSSERVISTMLSELTYSPTKPVWCTCFAIINSILHFVCCCGRCLWRIHTQMEVCILHHCRTQSKRLNIIHFWKYVGAWSTLYTLITWPESHHHVHSLLGIIRLAAPRLTQKGVSVGLHRKHFCMYSSCKALLVRLGE